MSCPTGGRRDEHIASGPDHGPAAELGLDGSGELRLESFGNQRVEIRQGHQAILSDRVLPSPGRIPGPLVERIQDCYAAAFEVTNVSCNQCELMNLGGGGDQHVGLRANVSPQGQPTSELARAHGDLRSNWKNLTMCTKKTLEPSADSCVWLPGEAEEYLLHSNHAQNNPSGLCRPLDDTRIR